MSLIDRRIHVRPVTTAADPIRRTGFWSALVAFVTAVLCNAAQIVSPPLIPLLAFPWSDVLIVAPSLLVPPALLLALNCLHAGVHGPEATWSRAALGFATISAVLVDLVHIVQLGAVIPARVRGEGGTVRLVALSQAWVQAVDAWGWAMMSVALLLAAWAVRPVGAGRAARWAFLAHGLLAPFVVLPLWIPPLLAVGSLRFVTGPLALFCLLRLFARDSTAPTAAWEADLAR
jgi:uncharacterized protein YqgC (DUF456 family)